MQTVGTFEARKHLSRLLDRVAHGDEITITRHGKPIARLVPFDARAVMSCPSDLALRIDEARRGVRLGRNVSLRKLIEDGRRY
jgi:prevent-host-death family protein